MGIYKDFYFKSRISRRPNWYKNSNYEYKNYLYKI